MNIITTNNPSTFSCSKETCISDNRQSARGRISKHPSALWMHQKALQSRSWTMNDNGEEERRRAQHLYMTLHCQHDVPMSWKWDCAVEARAVHVRIHHVILIVLCSSQLLG